jgi:hypothetical protein
MVGLTGGSVAWDGVLASMRNRNGRARGDRKMDEREAWGERRCVGKGKRGGGLGFPFWLISFAMAIT